MTDITVVVGGQFGSEAKGATVAYLAKYLDERDTVIRVAGPNAGHTAYSPDGREWKLRAVPVAAVVNDRVQLHIAAGSEIDPLVLASEITELEEAGIPITGRLSIHPSATILEARHIAAESESGLIGRVGSTGKGIGAARADRLMRRASIAQDLYAGYPGIRLAQHGIFDLTDRRRVIVEGTQGYGLGLHTTHYPQVTSSDCRAIDFLAMAGISPWASEVRHVDILVVARTFPIRVAGNSGPLKDETTWAELSLPEERTTVTNNVRRVGGWDLDLVTEAIQANGGGDWSEDVKLVLTMVDQRFPEAAGAKFQDELPWDARLWLKSVESATETEIALVGTSPTTMFEVDL